jgi:hypothetical protein
MAGVRPWAVDAPRQWILVRGEGSRVKCTQRSLWKQQQVGGGVVRVSILFEDAVTHGDDVMVKIGDEKDVACAEMVGPNETVEVRVREDVDLAPCAVKVGGDQSLVMALMGIKVYKAHHGRTSLQRDPEDDSNVVREVVTT